MDPHNTLLERVTLEVPPALGALSELRLTELVAVSSGGRYTWGFRAETEAWWNEVAPMHPLSSEEEEILESQLVFVLLRWAARSSFRLLIPPLGFLWRAGGSEVALLFAEASRSLGLPLGMTHYLCSSFECAEALAREGLRPLVEAGQWLPGYGAWVRSASGFEALIIHGDLRGLLALWELGGYEPEVWPLLDRGATVLLLGERTTRVRLGRR
jgi:hypothetical protein